MHRDRNEKRYTSRSFRRVYSTGSCRRFRPHSRRSCRYKYGATRIGGTSAARIRITSIGTIVAVAWAVGCVVFPRPIAVFAVFKITHFFVSPLIFLPKICLSCRMAVLKHTILDLSIENWEKNTNHNKKVPNHNIGHKIFD